MNILKNEFLKNNRILFINLNKQIFDLVVKDKLKQIFIKPSPELLAIIKQPKFDLVWFTSGSKKNESFCVLRLLNTSFVRKDNPHFKYLGKIANPIKKNYFTATLGEVIAHGLPSNIDTIEDIPTVCAHCKNALSISEIVENKCIICKIKPTQDYPMSNPLKIV